MDVADQNIGVLRSTAYALHKSGRLDAAIDIYESVAETHPNHADITGLLALAKYQTGKISEAFQFWEACLKFEAEVPIQLRNANNYMAALMKNGDVDTDRDAIDFFVPTWPTDLPLRQEDKSMLLSLVRALFKFDRIELASQLLQSAIHLIDEKKLWQMPTDSMAPERLLDAELVLLQAALFHSTGDAVSSTLYSSKAAELLPVYLDEMRPNQQFYIGVINPTPKQIDSTKTALEFHYSDNTTSSLALKFSENYRFLSVFPESDTALAALKTIPKPEFFINNWVNAELLSAPGVLEFISNFVDGLSCPVLNHPRKAAQTTRQRNATNLVGIPGLVVPQIMRFNNQPEKRLEIASYIQNHLGFPVIIRDPVAQMGQLVGKFKSSDDVFTHLQTLPATEHYAIQYIDNPVAPGLFRKIRAAIIGEDMIISHVHFSDQWNVHREHDDVKRAELNHRYKTEAFTSQLLNDPVATLGVGAWKALNEIKQRIDLDLFGIDFDLLPDGRILFFEANAAMNISFSGRWGDADTRSRMRDALNRLFEKTAGK